MKIAWGFIIFAIMSSLSFADTTMPSKETLLSNFDKLGIAAKSKWTNGMSPDGVKLLSYRVNGDIYSLNPDFISSFSIGKGDKNKAEFLHSEEVCQNLVYAVMGEKNNDIGSLVSNIIYGAARSVNKEAAAEIKDFWIEASFISIKEHPTLACKVSKMSTWD